MTLSNALRERIAGIIGSDRVVLFMKGTRQAPQCDFSASVVKILDRLLSEYTTVDVLLDPKLREGIKEYSDWPTIPQLYVNGEFLGGADIVREMYESGELQGRLREAERASPVARDPTAPPRIVVTAAAARAIEAAAKEDPDGPHLHLEVNAQYEHALYFAEPGPRDLEVDAGKVKLWIDPESASRANGVVIDYVEGPEGSGFTIDNPNKDAAKAHGAERPEGQPPMPKVEPPRLTVTASARAQFVAAVKEERSFDEQGRAFGIRVAARRMGATKIDYDLAVVAEDEKRPGDLIVEQGGLVFYMDPLSARNLDGATIDFVDDPERGSGFKFDNPKVAEGWQDPVAARFQKFLDEEINPSIAAHGGYVQLLDLVDGTAYVVMGGGCQGCGMASVTLYQGIHERVRQAIPEIERLVDTTDHAAGTNPYYQPTG